MIRLSWFFLALLLTACGQSGKLYLPDANHPETGHFLINHDSNTHS